MGNQDSKVRGQRIGFPPVHVYMFVYVFVMVLLSVSGPCAVSIRVGARDLLHLFRITCCAPSDMHALALKLIPSSAETNA